MDSLLMWGAVLFWKLENVKMCKCLNCKCWYAIFQEFRMCKCLRNQMWRCDILRMWECQAPSTDWRLPIYCGCNTNTSTSSSSWCCSGVASLQLRRETSLTDSAHWIPNQTFKARGRWSGLKGLPKLCISSKRLCLSYRRRTRFGVSTCLLSAQ